MATKERTAGGTKKDRSAGGTKCRNCSEPPLAGYKSCEWHILLDRERRAKKKAEKAAATAAKAPVREEKSERVKGERAHRYRLEKERRAAEAARTPRQRKVAVSEPLLEIRDDDSEVVAFLKRRYNAVAEAVAAVPMPAELDHLLDVQMPDAVNWDQAEWMLESHKRGEMPTKVFAPSSTGGEEWHLCQFYADMEWARFWGASSQRPFVPLGGQP